MGGNSVAADSGFAVSISDFSMNPIRRHFWPTLASVLASVQLGVIADPGATNPPLPLRVLLLSGQNNDTPLGKSPAQLQSPGRNAAGDTDWVLLLESTISR